MGKRKNTSIKSGNSPAVKKPKRVAASKTPVTIPNSNEKVAVIAPKQARVPAPAVKTFSPIHGGNAQRSIAAQQNRSLNCANHVADMWSQHAPTFTIPGVRLSELARRSKNAPRDISNANKKIERMSKQKADACSGRFVDDDGVTLACVFAGRVGPRVGKNESRAIPSEICSAADSPILEWGFSKPETDSPSRGLDSGLYESSEESELGLSSGPQNLSQKKGCIPAYPGPVRRTLEDLEPSKPYWDRITKTLLNRAHEATQFMQHELHPVAHQRDIRHSGENVMPYEEEEEEYKRDGIEEDPEQNASLDLHFERTGVSHLVHAWYQQGHKKGIMTMSQDMRGRHSGRAQMAVNHYFMATKELALHLKACFQKAFPQYCEQYEKAFEAGVWQTDDPGPWLGRAVVWKLQVNTHMDGLDGGPAAIFNFGEYEGGELYLPDLGLKLSYRPGDLVIFMAGHLYHHVSKWKPKPQSSNAKLTPGRVGHVFFFPEASLNTLVGKEEKWNVRTITGTIPNPYKS